MHFYITLASIAVPEKLLEWLCPMVALEEKSGDCMMNAIKMHWGKLMEPLKGAWESWTFVMSSDWAKANRKLFRQVLGAMTPPLAIHSKCLMHMIALAVGAGAV